MLQSYTTLPHRDGMFVTIDPRDGRPLDLQIMDEVRRAVVVGRLKPDDPSRRFASSPRARDQSANGLAGIPGAGT